MARSDDLDYKLEQIIDATSVAKVLDMMSGICGQKADHIQSNWQDAPLARKWQRASDRLHKLSGEFRNKNL